MKDTLDKAKTIANIISLVAVPVILAVFGSLLQTAIKDREIRRDYVQLSVQILSQPNTAETNEIRHWARSVLTAHSPVPMSNMQLEQLEMYLSPPPLSVMQPPKTEQRLRELLFGPDVMP